MVEWGLDRRAAWRDAAERIDAYRGRYGITDQERALGEVPKDPERRGVWKRVQDAISQARDEEPAAKVVGLDRHRGQHYAPAGMVARGRGGASGGAG